MQSRARMLGGILMVSCLACAGSQPSRQPDDGAAAREEVETFAPAFAPLRCANGLSRDAVAIDWQILKTDDLIGPADVTVFLNVDRTCSVAVGDLPRLCAVSDDRMQISCTKRDGTRPHRVRVQRQPDRVEVWVDTPETSVLLATQTI